MMNKIDNRVAFERGLCAKHEARGCGYPKIKVSEGEVPNAYNIYRKCMITGAEYTVVARVDRIQAYLIRGELIQNAFPAHTADQREFILNNTTPAEYKDRMPHEEEDYDLPDIDDPVF